MRRREWLIGAAALPRALRARPDGTAPCDLAAAWADEAGRQFAGVLRLDLEAGEVRLRWQRELPGRAHGLLALPGGGLLVLAVRPGRWLLRLAEDGAVQALHRLDGPAEPHTLGGHAALSADARVLYTTETDARGQGRIGVRDAATLRRLDDWSSGGLEPHHLLPSAGRLWVANGGIRRGEGDRKVDLGRMVSSLVALDPDSGRLLEHARLADPRLSLRHLAASTDPADGRTRIGVALQAEHEDPSRREAAPALAVWDGTSLQLTAEPGGVAGYAGDIAAAPGGGFVVSSPRAHRALWWRPDAAPAVAAELREAGALAAWGGDGAAAVLLAAARGIGAWHPQRAARLLRWPQAMALDNHWCVLGAPPA